MEFYAKKFLVNTLGKVSINILITNFLVMSFWAQGNLSYLVAGLKFNI